jgi:L-fucose isomerase-like protein
MSTLKVGFITCGVHVKVTDSFGRPFIDYQMLEQAVNSLKGAGLDVYRFKEFVRTKKDAMIAIENAEKENVDCIIFYAATWLWASEIVGAATLSSKPILIWTTPISQGWATGGALVLHGTFDEIDLKHKFVYGFPDDPETIKKIKSYANASRVINQLKGSTVGLIGGIGMGAFPGRVDEAFWMKKFSLNVDQIDQYAIIRKAEQISKEEVTSEYKELKNIVGDVPPLDDVMDRSVRLFLAMKKVIQESAFDFTTLKCFPEIGDNYATACLAQSLLGNQGFTSACIGDLNTALTAYILHLLTGFSVFNPDVQRVRKSDGVVVLTSDGACPLNFAENKKEVKLGKRGVFGEGEADGICVGLVCKPGLVTLARLMRIKGKYFMHIALGESYVPPKSKLQKELNECGFPYWPHAFIKLKGDVDLFIQNQRSEYISMCYGDLKEELLDLCYLLDIEPIVTG